MEIKKMPIISQKDSDLLTSGRLLGAGILANPNLFPEPPVPGKVLLAECDTCQKNAEEEMAAKAVYEDAAKKKKDSFANLETMFSNDRTYCKVKAKESKDPSSYTKAGLPLPKGRATPQVPGMCLGFSVISQGIGSAVFQVKRPADGSGGITKYIEIQFKDADALDDIWGIASTTMTSRAKVFNMPLGKTIIFRAIAVNKVGAGVAGNVISIKF